MYFKMLNIIIIILTYIALIFHIVQLVVAE